MDTQTYIRDIILPGAYALLDPKMNSDEATLLQLAIGFKESHFVYRRQVKGPAVSFWQFEKSGITGVLRHPVSKPIILPILKTLGYDYSVVTVYEAMEHNDVLGAVMSRSLLWTDPRPLPKEDDVQGALDYYLRNWRPGNPRVELWPKAYQRAKELFHARSE